MATRTYDGTYPDDASARETVTEDRGYRDVGATIFLWVVWTLAFAFWAFTMSSFFGILQALGDHPALMNGEIDAGAAGYAVATIGAVIVLGLLMIWGAARWATRDKSLDPMTEAATARLYDEGATRPRA